MPVTSCLFVDRTIYYFTIIPCAFDCTVQERARLFKRFFLSGCLDRFVSGTCSCTYVLVVARVECINAVFTFFFLSSLVMICTAFARCVVSFVFEVFLMFHGRVCVFVCGGGSIRRLFLLFFY